MQRTWRAGEHLGHRERLRQEALNLASAGHGHLVLRSGSREAAVGARRVCAVRFCDAYLSKKAGCLDRLGIDDLNMFNCHTQYA